MIKLGPLNDENKVKEFFSKVNIEYNNSSNCVSAMLTDECLGFCLYDMDDKKIIVRYIEPQDDLSLMDGILRSTLHVAAERSIMDAYYSKEVSEEALKKIGFIKNEKEKRLDIDKLFGGCSCKK